MVSKKLAEFDTDLLQDAWNASVEIDSLLNTIPFFSYIHRMDADEVIQRNKNKNKNKKKTSNLDPANWATTSERVIQTALSRKKKNVKQSDTENLEGLTRADLQARMRAKIDALVQSRKLKEEQVQREKEERRLLRAQQQAANDGDSQNASQPPSKKPRLASVESKTESASEGGSDNDMDIDFDLGKIITIQEKQQKVDQLKKTAGIPLPAGSKKKKLREALKEIEESKAKIAAATTEEEREKIKQDLAVERAMARAEGRKLKTDASKVKRSLRLIDQKKAKAHEKAELKRNAKEISEKEQAEREEAKAKSDPKNMTRKQRQALKKEREHKAKNNPKRKEEKKQKQLESKIAKADFDSYNVE